MLMWAGIQGGEDDLVHSASEKGRQYEDSCDGENKETQEQGQEAAEPRVPYSPL